MCVVAGVACFEDERKSYAKNSRHYALFNLIFGQPLALVLFFWEFAFQAKPAGPPALDQEVKNKKQRTDDSTRVIEERARSTSE